MGEPHRAGFLLGLPSAPEPPARDPESGAFMLFAPQPTARNVLLPIPVNTHPRTRTRTHTHTRTHTLQRKPLRKLSS